MVTFWDFDSTHPQCVQLDGQVGEVAALTRNHIGNPMTKRKVGQVIS